MSDRDYIHDELTNYTQAGRLSVDHFEELVDHVHHLVDEAERLERSRVADLLSSNGTTIVDYIGHNENERVAVRAVLDLMDLLLRLNQP